MINRILIRIKVVQILYSYLLSRNEFKIDAAPEAATRERRFSYAVYLDTLNLVQELSGVRTNVPSRSLPAIDVDPKMRLNRVGKALSDNHALKEITFKDAAHLNDFGPVLQKIADRIYSATAFKDYSRKRNKDLEQDVNIWCVLLESVLLKDTDFQEALRKSEDFSLSGMHNGVRQAIDTLRAYNDSRAMYEKAKKDLALSLEKAYELYFSFFQLIVELTDEQAMRLDAAKTKYLATADDLNPDTRFVDNTFARFLASNERLEVYGKDHNISWLDAPGLIKSLLDSILASDIYAEYMARETTDWRTDCEFWRSILRSVILPSDALADAMEEKSVFWNDDITNMGTFALKSIRQFASSENGEGIDFLPKFKDEEDEHFGAALFTAAVDNREKYREYIDKFINTDWDPERLAFMDIVIMIAAIAEILNFPGIPLPVSLNEYIEIANAYSTHRSGPFINGILYSVVNMLADEGLLRKPFTRTEERSENQ